MYEVHLSQKADKFLNKLNENIKERVIDKLKELAYTPVPTEAKFISRDEDGKIFRYRVGSLRALYKLKENSKIILITKIDKRPRIYHR